ncbi:MAG: GNAT family N-acetyltransferase [Vicinamibacterales bacterium]
MTSPAQFRPSRLSGDLKVARVGEPCAELNRFLYTAVGGDYHWTDCLDWTYAEWQRFVERRELHTWVGYVHDTPAGYFELEERPDRSVHILHFGLLRQFIGRGLGGQLLTEAVLRGWELLPERLCLHTNTLDGEHALANYLARGFVVVDAHRTRREIPGVPPGPWPGSGPRLTPKRST